MEYLETRKMIITSIDSEDLFKMSEYLTMLMKDPYYELSIEQSNEIFDIKNKVDSIIDDAGLAEEFFKKREERRKDWTKRNG